MTKTVSYGQEPLIMKDNIVKDVANQIQNTANNEMNYMMKNEDIIKFNMNGMGLELARISPDGKVQFFWDQIQYHVENQTYMSHLAKMLWEAREEGRKVQYWKKFENDNIEQGKYYWLALKNGQVVAGKYDIYPVFFAGGRIVTQEEVLYFKEWLPLKHPNECDIGWNVFSDETLPCVEDDVSVMVALKDGRISSGYYIRYSRGFMAFDLFTTKDVTHWRFPEIPTHPDHIR